MLIYALYDDTDIRPSDQPRNHWIWYTYKLGGAAQSRTAPQHIMDYRALLSAARPPEPRAHARSPFATGLPLALAVALALPPLLLLSGTAVVIPHSDGP